jgi:hypothetical protein
MCDRNKRQLLIFTDVWHLGKLDGVQPLLESQEIGLYEDEDEEEEAVFFGPVTGKELCIRSINKELIDKPGWYTWQW